jgi:heterodisulfide reductase subunit D
VNPEFEEIAAKYKTTTCSDCDLCLEVCPAHRYDETFAPKTIARAVLQDGEIPDHIWTCLTCRQCETRCPVDGVRFAYFIRDMRAPAFEAGQRPKASHAGVLPSIQRIMAKRDLAQNRLDWIGEDLRTDPHSDTLLLVGCTPYYEDLFSEELRFHPIETPKAAVRLLNAVGIEPSVIRDEVCCGHDLLWTGDVAGFRALAQKNIEAIKTQGAKQVVTLCPECLATIGQEYNEFFGEMGWETRHISQVLAERSGSLRFAPLQAKVAYWDSCRMGRYCRIFDEPRRLVSLAARDVVELPKNEEDASCCGSPCFSGCGTMSSGVQQEILSEAEKAGAQILITACPRAEMHFRCALRSEAWKTSHVEVAELAAFLASRLADPNKTNSQP